MSKLDKLGKEVGRIYIDKEGMYGVAVKSKYADELPKCAATVLTACINFALSEVKEDPIEVMKMCKQILQVARESNGLKFEPVEYVDNDNDIGSRRDRMGL